jgi:hypothetical protein
MYEDNRYLWIEALEELSTAFIAEREYSKAPFFKSICEASDSNQPVRMCWCAECAEWRKEYGVRKARETKAYAYN